VALKKLIKHRHEIWLDLGIRDIQDLFDSFAMDISWAVAGSLSYPSIAIFEEIYEFSDRCVPCAYIDREVRWDGGEGPRDLRRLLGQLTDMGFERIAVIDFNRLGEREGFSHDMGAVLEGMDPELVIGGGVRESDFDSMIEMGFTGALVDPFIPIIESIIEGGEEAELADAPEPTARPVGRENAVPTADLTCPERVS
jgi:uncharacterized protein related to proFAR isomerase